MDAYSRCEAFARGLTGEPDPAPTSIPFCVIGRELNPPTIVFYRALLVSGDEFRLANPACSAMEAQVERVRLYDAEGRSFFLCTNHSRWLYPERLRVQGYVALPQPGGEKLVFRPAELGGQPLSVQVNDQHPLEVVPVWTWGSGRWLVDYHRLPGPPQRPPSHVWVRFGDRVGQLVAVEEGYEEVHGTLEWTLGVANRVRARVRESKYGFDEWYVRNLPRYLAKHREVEP